MKALIILTLLIAASISIESDSNSICHKTGEKIIKDLMRGFDASYAQKNFDTAYIDAHILQFGFEKFASVCNKKISLYNEDEEFVQNKQQDNPPKTDCIKVQERLYEYTKTGDPFHLLSEATDFYSVLTTYTMKCNPYVFYNNLSISEEPNAKLGMKCAVCGFLVTLIENYANFHSVEISQIVAEKIICVNMTGPLKTTCELSVEVLGPALIQGFTNNYTSDVICGAAGQCKGYSQCKLHPKTSAPSNSNTASKMNDIQQKIFEHTFQSQMTNGGRSPWDWIIKWIKRFSDYKLPLFDLDGDSFSDVAPFRGYDWKGFDCEPLNPNVYPGKKSPQFVGDDIDYNCNGIHGRDPDTKKTYKELYCDGHEQQGVLLIGDSAGAHFSIPGDWLNVSAWHPGTFKGFIKRLANELDLPQMSAGTGWEKLPYVDSGYLQNFRSNRCNRGDYQNIGVNGARSGNVGHYINQALTRNQLLDQPVMLQWELIGNDVCNGHPGFEHMTTPEEFRENILNLWAILDTKLPKGSHMVVTGVADGTVLYDILHNQLEPIGVTYEVIYNYLNCLEISPCWGWMNSDAAVRIATTARANELNVVYKQIIAEQKYTNFDIYYLDVPQDEIFARAEALGFSKKDCIEPVDGFHPSQLANYLIAQIDAEKMLAARPSWIPPVNPNNEEIEKRFPFIIWP